MPRTTLRPAYLLAPLALAAAMGCEQPTEPRFEPLTPAFAQGTNGVWTVNSLADPGDGVCDDSECTLREAIAAAANGDHIVFGPALQGNVALTAGQLDLVGRALSIDGGGRIVIDAQGNSRVMSVRSNILAGAVALTGLTLKNGNESGEAGGGLYASGAAVTLDRVIVTENRSLVEGGGMFLEASDVTIGNSVISRNEAANLGGGISTIRSTLRLTDSTLELNVTNNFGGGALFSGANARTFVYGSTVSDNHARGSSGVAGGLWLGSGELTITNSTISGNSATGGAGVINGDALGVGTPAGGILTIRHSTITANISSTGSGITHGGNGANHTTVANSIVAGNANSDCSAPSGGFSSAGYNLGETDPNGACAVYFVSPGDVLVNPAQVFTDVLEQALSDNGGPTKTHALIVRGRAVDAGYCPGQTKDQRGFQRPVDDPSMPNAVDACDIGAYELQGPVIPVADLMVSQSVDRASVKQGDLLTYSIRVRNLGPQTAPNVILTDLLSSGVTFVDARMNKGTVTAPPRGETGTVTWYLGDLQDQENQVAEIVVTVLVRGKTTITSTASVTGDVADPNVANNSAAITVSVGAGAGGGGPKK